MSYFTVFTFLNDYHLILGMENKKMVFCHCYRKKSQIEKILTGEKRFFPNLVENKEMFTEVIDNLTSYFTGKDIDPVTFPVNFSRGTDFEIRVWHALRTVAKSRTITYKQLAELSGYPDAQRAVGNTMAKNYLLLFVPCHRVINKNGQLGGFGCGIEMKRRLLALEKQPQSHLYQVPAADEGQNEH